MSRGAIGSTNTGMPSPRAAPRPRPTSPVVSRPSVNSTMRGTCPGRSSARAWLQRLLEIGGLAARSGRGAVASDPGGELAQARVSTRAPATSGAKGDDARMIGPELAVERVDARRRVGDRLARDAVRHVDEVHDRQRATSPARSPAARAPAPAPRAAASARPPAGTAAARLKFVRLRAQRQPHRADHGEQPQRAGSRPA